MRVLLVLLAGISLAACRDGQTANAVRGPVDVVDSILTTAEATSRFVRGLPHVSSLEGGAPTDANLLVKLAGALRRSDTTAVAEMVVSHAEYGHLYYPSSVYTRKPYELAPDVAWLLTSESNAKGRRRILQRLGGKPVSLANLRCGDPTREGSNTIRKDCTVEVSAEDEPPVRLKLFHSIIERGGQTKILSLAGDY